MFVWLKTIYIAVLRGGRSLAARPLDRALGLGLALACAYGVYLALRAAYPLLTKAWPDPSRLGLDAALLLLIALAQLGLAGALLRAPRRAGSHVLGHPIGLALVLALWLAALYAQRAAGGKPLGVVAAVLQSGLKPLVLLTSLAHLCPGAGRPAALLRLLREQTAWLLLALWGSYKLNEFWGQPYATLHPLIVSQGLLILGVIFYCCAQLVNPRLPSESPPPAAIPGETTEGGV